MNAHIVPTEVWVKGDSDNYILPVLSPSAWTGEADCVIGPFTNRETAEYFVTVTTEQQFDVLTEHIFARGDSWYVETEALSS